MYSTAGPGPRAAQAPRRRRRRGSRARDHWFSSQTRRSPSSVRYGSTCPIVLECGATSSARPPVATTGRRAIELAADRRDDPVYLAGEAVDDAGLETSDRRLADHARRLDVVDLDEPRRTGEQRVHRDLDPRREDAADVLAVGRHDVEVRGRPEVDDDHGRAEARLRGDRVDDPVRSDLAGVVVADRDSGRTPGPTASTGRAPAAASRSHSRRSSGTVVERQIPSTASGSSIPPSRTPSSSPVRLDRSPPASCRRAARRRTARARSGCCPRRRREAWRGILGVSGSLLRNPAC